MHSRPVIRLVACGSVDDGKSTLIGRLLVETDSVPHDTVAAARSVRRAGSLIPPGEIDYSLLTDGLEAEREQGITIDVAYRSMSLLDGRRLLIADAPGHEQYTRNMAVAASRADIAVMLVDATHPLRPQTFRHLTILKLMGVDQIIVALNKLDALNFDQAAFESVCRDTRPAVERLGIDRISYIPISALVGDNVTAKSDRTPWHTGPTLLEAIQGWHPLQSGSSRARMGVQIILRAENFRGLAGTVSDGSFAVGDEVVILPGLNRARIARLTAFDGEIAHAHAGKAVAMVLEPDVDATRGDVVERVDGCTTPADRFAAHVVWLSESELIHSRSYYLLNGSTMVPATVTAIRHRLNIRNGDHESARTLKINEIGVIEVATDARVALAPYGENRNSGNFILVDRVSLNTVGAGMVIHALRRATNITEHHYAVTKAVRAAQKHQRARLVWLTGLSGSGKSTLADALERRLYGLGLHSYVLDGDNLRLGLNKDLGFTKEDRAENVRRVAEVGRLMVDAGLVVIVALVSPFAIDRNHARELFEEGEFIEVWVKTPTEICAQRDPKGLYRKAKAGLLPNLTGVGQEYEPPANPELVLDGTEEIAVNVEKLVRALV
ncbi:MAG TPA: adenylyl-sulfate kinase [Verrucomicrobiota bacterium]|nr:adenylyl-sulfate kinase [Verrucomicrobiota bacterium]HRZ36708.1 adenylyl-sulfate kinase [Candidatus Paceibacterota bacterium]